MGENHGKNELLCTDFLKRDIRQSFAGESCNVKQLENWLLSGSKIRLVAIPLMFPSFPHTFAHVSPIVSPVSLGISHVSPGVSPRFLF